MLSKPPIITQSVRVRRGEKQHISNRLREHLAILSWAFEIIDCHDYYQVQFPNWNKYLTFAWTIIGDLFDQNFSMKSSIVQTNYQNWGTIDGIKLIRVMYLCSFRKIFSYKMEIESWFRIWNTKTRIGSRELIMITKKEKSSKLKQEVPNRFHSPLEAN